MTDLCKYCGTMEDNYCDCLDRMNCKRAGEPGHSNCGKLDCGCPLFTGCICEGKEVKMDPDVALQNAIDAYIDNETDDFVESMNNLANWIINGGFLPSAKALRQKEGKIPNCFAIYGYAARFRYDKLLDKWFFETFRGDYMQTQLPLPD